MDDTAETIHRNRHAVAGAVGAVTFLLFWLVSGWGFIGSLIVGVVVYALVLVVITMIGGTQAARAGTPAPKPLDTRPPVAGGGAASGGGAAGATAPVVTGTPVGEGPRTDPAPKAVPVAADERRVPEPEPVAPVAQPVEPDPARPSPVVPATGDAESDEVGTKPPTYDAPRGGEGDDLRLIRGVGPKLESLCHRLGIWHFDQIAAWTDAEIEWVDAHLEGFRGRVRRDDWVAQATTLASGSATGPFERDRDGGPD